MFKRAVLIALIASAVPATAHADDDHFRTYRGRSQYVHCRNSAGTAGLVAGGVGGAILGGSIIGGGLAGPLIGGVAGALGGRAIDRSMTAHKRCR